MLSLKKGVKFEWTQSCADAFDKLKRALISAPILAYPDFKREFLLFVDASSTGIGFTLAQNQNEKEVVIAYNGRGLNIAEQNYSTTEREALALVEGIKKFQPYLFGRKFTVLTDHSSLRWLMNMKDATGRLARWSLLLQQYDFEIVHRPGKEHSNADSLSRRPYEIDSCLNTLQKEDPQLARTRDFQRRDCSMRKSPRNSKRAPLLPIPVGSAFERVAVDVLGPFPPSRKGNRYIVVFSDYLTRWCEAFAVPNAEATVIARLLVDEIIARHGAPKVLLFFLTI